MEKLTVQAIFTLIWNFYANGGTPGFDGALCVYFTPTGGRCAWGVVLEHLGMTRDRACALDINEGVSALQLRKTSDIWSEFADKIDEKVWEPLYQGPGDDHDVSFPQAIQSVHDLAAKSSSPRARLHNGLVYFAEAHGIEIPNTPWQEPVAS